MQKSKMIKVKKQKFEMDKSQNGNSQAKSRNKQKLKWQKVRSFLRLKCKNEVKCKESKAENIK